MTQQKCNSPNCNLIAEYRAPLSPDNLKEYQWFCLKHIKEYNKNWNYFENMSADEIEEFIENDIIGHRKPIKLAPIEAIILIKPTKFGKIYLIHLITLEMKNLALIHLELSIQMHWLN